jgi:Tol biopolymer transport system component
MMNRNRHHAIWIGLAAAWVLAGAAAPASATTFTPLLADTSFRETDPAPSPDGKWLAFQSNRGGTNQIWLLPIDGGAPHALTTEPESSTVHSGVRVMTPTWAPDGKSVLYVSTRSGPYNIYSIPVEGGESRPLSNAAGSQRFPSYSMDGQKIVFPSSRLAPTELYGFNLYVMDAKGEIEGPPAKRLTFDNGSPGHPIWSPDGKWVAFVAKDVDTTRTISLGSGMQTKESAMFARFRLYKIPAGGGKEIQLTGLTPEKQPSEDTWPSWSPDGKWIAFGRNVGGKSNIWVYEVATKRMFPISTSDNAMKPTFSYDGKAIYYAVLNGKDEDLWVATDLTLKPPASTGTKKSGTKPASTAKKTSSSTAKSTASAPK